MVRINHTLVTVLIVDLLATSGEITNTWTSPMYPKLYSNDTSQNPLDKPITKSQDSWIASLVNIGAIIGSLPAGIISASIGRRKMLLGIAVPHITAYLIYAFANDVYLFYVGRLVNGLSVGAGYAILPIYLEEVTEDSNRAALSATLNIFWTLGILIPYAIGPYLKVQIFNLILAAIPSSFLVGFLLCGIESPHHLVVVGQYSNAKVALMKLRSCSKEAAEIEVEMMTESLKSHKHVLSDLITDRGLRKALLVSFMLMALQQFAGINAVAYYLQPIFEASETGLSSSISSTICGACMFSFSFVAPLIVQRVGTKWPLGISCLGTSLSSTLLGAFFYIKDETSISSEHIYWMPITGLMGYLFFYTLALGPLPWVISSELFPDNVKVISSSAVAGCCWTFSFIVTRSFNMLTDTVGKAGTFWMFACVGMLGVILDIIFVPETQGETLDEIQDQLND